MRSSDREMSIGELAARFDLAPHVLRHWEAMGLLVPTTRRNGRRRYDAGHIARVAMIVRGKAAGMSLEQLAEVLRSTSRDQRHEVLRRHHAELELRLRQLETSKSMIEHAMSCDAEDFTQCPAFRRLVAETADARHDPACADTLGTSSTGSGRRR
ncbi:MerR family transcriptional regulator [Nocardia sp. NPDC127526]|uniref:helix-turn-helix domain-containing protein n=1 Tax=Nocardia sp. NPDC127526 TaxID=3345393 RepID=UPI003634C916